MNFVAALLLCLSLILSSLNPFVPATFAFTKKVSDGRTAGDTPTLQNSLVQLGDVPQSNGEETDNTTNTDGAYMKANNFVNLDLSGYCTINMPQSHFTLSNSSSDRIKMMTYKDNKTRLTMSYVTDMGSDADIPGFITREQAGVETTTNNRVEETYGDNKTWTKIKAEGREEGCNVYIWYTLNSDKSAAFWVKAKVAPDADCQEFYDAVAGMFDSFSCYYIAGAMFETPTTGYYENYVDNDTTKGDTSDYVSNDRANTVFKDRGGYIKGANISADWKDLEIILDGTKFQIPCSIGDFFEAGFDLNTRDVTTSTLIKKSRTSVVSFINSKGTVIKLTLLNESDMVDKPLDECSVVEILVDSSDFVSIKEVVVNEKDEAKEKYKERERELLMEYGADIPEEYRAELDELKKLFSNEPADEDDSESDKEDVNTKSTDAENTETNENAEGTGSEDTSESDDSKADENDVELKDENSDAVDKEVESEIPLGTTEDDLANYDHELILAGGVTWGVYFDDLVSYYGKNCSKVKSSNNTYNCTYTSENKSMSINIGKLKGINRVKLSCIQE